MILVHNLCSRSWLWQISFLQLYTIYWSRKWPVTCLFSCFELGLSAWRFRTVKIRHYLACIFRRDTFPLRALVAHGDSSTIFCCDSSNLLFRCLWGQRAQYDAQNRLYTAKPILQPPPLHLIIFYFSFHAIKLRLHNSVDHLDLTYLCAVWPRGYI